MAAITAIELNKSSFNLVVGNTYTLEITKTPEDGEGTITWESSDEEVATVADGTVTAVAEGTATIKASAGEGIEATAEVTVISEVVVPPFGWYNGKIPEGILYVNTVKNN